MSFKGLWVSLILATVASVSTQAAPEASNPNQPPPVMESDPKDFMLHSGLKLKNSVISSVLAKLNNQLQFINTANDAKALAYHEFANKVAERTKDDPDQPFDNEIISYPHQTLGVNFNASRHVTPRTVKGSRTPLQLVDNLSISVGLGVYNTIDSLGAESVLRSSTTVGANVAAVRDYTHVRPLKSVQETGKYAWREILIPSYMKSLADLLEKSENPGESSLKVLMREMQDGEVFSVTDSIATAASLRTSSTLQILFGLNPVSFINSVTVGADTTRVIIRQVNFQRVVKGDFDGFHVYVRDLKNKGRGLEANVNFFLNLLRARAQARESDVQTEAYLFNLKDPKDPSLAVKLGKVLPPLLKANKYDSLAREFSEQKFEVQHDLQEEEAKLKLFVWRMARFKEDHTLDLKIPPSLQQETGISTDQISLFASRRGRLKGVDKKTFSYDAADAYIKYKDLFDRIRISRSSGSASDNPANTSGGRAEWRLITTEADLTEKTSGNLPSLAILQHIWGGWSMKKKQFLETVAELQKPYLDAGLGGGGLINPDHYEDVKSVDFYRISANATILEKGLEKIRDLLLQPEASYRAPVRGHSLENFFRKLKCKQQNSAAECNLVSRVGNDQEFFSEMLKIFGNGNPDAGRKKYLEICESENHKPEINNWNQPVSNPTVYRGGSYECLTKWMKKLIKLSHQYPAQGKKEQIRWITEVLSVLDDKIPMPQILDYVGRDNYVFLMRIQGFRVKENGGDFQHFSNQTGDVRGDLKDQFGLINHFTRKTGISPAEMERTLSPF